MKRISNKKAATTRREIAPATKRTDHDVDLHEIFAGFDQIRERVRRSGKKIDIRKLIEAGRV